MSKKTVKEEIKKTTQFDKFIDDQINRQAENTKRQKNIQDLGETPQQKYNKMYRETPSNRTVWRKR
jgi:hypothetical protein